MGLNEIDRRIPHETLATIRGILVKSLSRENLSETDLTLFRYSNHNNNNNNRKSIYHQYHHRDESNDSHYTGKNVNLCCSMSI